MEWSPIGIWRWLWQGFMHTSILTGWLPLTLEVVTVIMVVASIHWRARHELRRLVIGAIISIVVVASIAVISIWTGLVHANIPPWPYVWGGVAVLALWITINEWKTAEEWRRVTSVTSIILALVCTLGAINVYTETFITVYRLGSGQPENVLNLPGLDALKQQVAQTGKLPTNGVVVVTTIPPLISNFQTRQAYIYLPPAWFAKNSAPLPTLVLLPGEPGGAADWSSSGDADTTANAFAKTNGGVTPILIMPDSNGIKTVDSECVNSQFGNAETYLAKDIPNYAHAVLGASRAPGSMAIAGLSAGGTCSMILALDYPDVYPTFASYSGFEAPQYENDTVQQTVSIFFGGSQSSYENHSPLQVLQSSPNGYSGSAGWFQAGSGDAPTVAAAKALRPAATKAGMATCFLISPGGHDFLFWAGAFHTSLPWISWRLGLLADKPDTSPATCTNP